MDARAHCVCGGCRHAVDGGFRRSLIRLNCAILSIRIRRATELEAKDAHAKMAVQFVFAGLAGLPSIDLAQRPRLNPLQAREVLALGSA